MASLARAMEAVLLAFEGCTLGGQPLRAVMDPQDVNPPCVFVPFPELDFTYSKMCVDVTWTAFLVAGQSPGPIPTTRVLSDLLDVVVGLYPFDRGVPYALALPGGGPPAPAVQLTWPERIPIGA